MTRPIVGERYYARISEKTKIFAPRKKSHSQHTMKTRSKVATICEYSFHYKEKLSGLL